MARRKAISISLTPIKSGESFGMIVEILIKIASYERGSETRPAPIDFTLVDKQPLNMKRVFFIFVAIEADAPYLALAVIFWGIARWAITQMKK